MSSLWEKKLIEADAIVTPKDIIQEQCKALAELTNGKIIARISEYDGEVKTREHCTLEKLSGIYDDSVSDRLLPKFVTDFDAQDVLGEDDNSAFKYEFFITSAKTPKYKFRVFFISHDVGIYPVHYTVKKEIADEIGIETEIEAANQEEFTEILRKILNSEYLTNVISNLLRLNK